MGKWRRCDGSHCRLFATTSRNNSTSAGLQRGKRGGIRGGIGRTTPALLCSKSIGYRKAALPPSAPMNTRACEKSQALCISRRRPDFSTNRRHSDQARVLVRQPSPPTPLRRAGSWIVAVEDARGMSTSFRRAVSLRPRTGRHWHHAVPGGSGPALGPDDADADHRVRANARQPGRMRGICLLTKLIPPRLL